jgi:hypothetical protein
MTAASVTAPVPCLLYLINGSRAILREHTHIVIEHGVFVSVGSQQPVGVCDTKVFKVEKTVREILPNKLHKPVRMIVNILDVLMFG